VECESKDDTDGTIIVSKDVIISLINKASYKQLMKQKQTQKKVGDLMGGKVLDLEIIKAHDDGIKEGKEEEKVSSLRSMILCE